MENEEYDFENLTIGSEGTMVYILQKNLNHIREKQLVEDGIFGEKTLEAVQEFQAQHNLEVNGIVDYKTIIEIDSEYEMQRS
ncbi:peptidoglycan-binding protein [bacterium]|nr:peptidoglycan-binding protein [bacterium]MBU1956830.1 peptidoglycan-binding protein [bacterium]